MERSGTTRDAAAEAELPILRRPRRTELNVVPLVDVLFLLLLFFILGTRFRQAEGLLPGSLPRIDRPSPAGGGDPLALQVRVHVRQGLDVTGQSQALFEVGGTPAAMESPEDLFRNLQQRKQSLGGLTDETTVLIVPGSDVRWQFAVEAFNQARRAKFRQVTFANRRE